MNPILILIYHSLKRLTKTVFGIFFSKTTILNKENLKINGATILVSNHPNTLLDPLNAASRVSPIVHFLANAGLFRVPVLGPILNKLYCIPIERSKDVNGRSISNGKNFEKCDAFLSGGGCLYIAPEGTSEMEHKLRPLKTGTARIALRAASKNNFNLGLTILPVGLTYSSPSDFRSEVIVNAGRQIKIADYKTLFEEDNFKAARKLTKDLQDALGALIYNTDDDSEEAFIKNIETINNNESPQPAEQQFFRTKDYIYKTRELKNDDPYNYEHLNKKVSNYFSDLHTLNINDKSVFESQKKQNTFLNVFYLAIGFPLFIYGYVNNFLAFFTPALLAKKLNLYIGYTSTVKALSGIFTLPIFYTSQILLVQNWFGNSMITLFYGLSLLPLGWLAWEYLTFSKQYFKDTRAKRLLKNGDQKMANLIESRKSLLKSLTSISSVVKI